MAVFDLLEYLWLPLHFISQYHHFISSDGLRYARICVSHWNYSVWMITDNLKDPEAFKIVCDHPDPLLQFPEHAGPSLGKFKLATPVTEQADIFLGMPALARHSKGWIL